MKRHLILIAMISTVLLTACQNRQSRQSASRQDTGITRISDFHNGLALVRNDEGKYGYMDQEHQMVVPTQYDYAADFSEGLALVSVSTDDGSTGYMVIDTLGQPVFGIALDSCMLASGFRDGVLWYRDMRTKREGYLDRRGHPTAGRPQHGDRPQADTLNKEANEPRLIPAAKAPVVTIREHDWQQEAKTSPFYKEARKVVAGGLQEHDMTRRTTILNYMEHLRTSYTTKDIDFLKQLFSDEALIIVGHVVRKAGTTDIGTSSQVSYAIHSKRAYMERLSRVFAANKHIQVTFSDFSIKRHPTIDGIYGVTLRQAYRSDRYSDDGWLFLLWDFRDETAPRIHVRTWQEAFDLQHHALSPDSVFGIHDFNLN